MIDDVVVGVSVEVGVIEEVGDGVLESVLLAVGVLVPVSVLDGV